MKLVKTNVKSVIKETQKEISYDIYEIVSDSNPDYKVKIVLSKDNDGRKYQKLVLDKCIEEQNKSSK